MDKTQRHLNQTMALAGVFQAASLVEQIAKHGQPSQSSFETLIKSILNQNPNSVQDVYGDSMENLKIGLQELKGVLGSDRKELSQDTVRYALSILHLESVLRKAKGSLAKLGEGIEVAARQAEHFEPTHENVISNLGGLYQETLSKFRFRVHVTGNPQYLQNSLNAAKIRSLLLSGVRSATLWRQLGGRRWQLLFFRKKLLKATETLLSKLD